MRGSAVALSLLMLSLVFAMRLGSAIAQSAPIQVLSYSSYIDSLSYLHVIGEVQNVGSNPLSQVTVAATLCDQSGHPTQTIQDYIIVDLLVPQQKSPFDLFENATGNLCSVSYLDSAVSDKLPYSDFQIANQSTSRDSEGIYHVVGQVNNTGASETQAVDVVASFYNASGVVVQAGSSVTNPPNLSPGKSGYFDVASDDPSMSAGITNFSLQVQSASPTLPVPEYTFTAPVLALSLAVVLVIKRRRTRESE